ncbi:MAG: 4Fe-4S binding protein [Candidatus Omnitrophota bacterium]|nr:4Fe-4S binding protein [Candidatus Omnitrophota bacterium]
MYFAAEVEQEKCKGCKLCIFSCPEPNAIIFKPAKKKVSIDPKRCKACGLCLEACKFLAVTITQVK